MSTSISDSTTKLKPTATDPADKQTATAPPQTDARFELPNEPLVTIQPGKSWSAFNVRDFWSYRELLYFLVWRDLKVRYKQTLLGVAWVIMQPLLMTLIFSVFLGMLARVPSGSVPYPLLVYGGLLPWTFFSSSVIGCSSSLVGSANLITKVYFPRMLIPAASVGARLVDFTISFVIFGCLVMYYREVLHYPISPTWKLAALPFLIILATLFAFGLGTVAAGLNVKYRDVGVVLPVLVQLGMFVSPVLYPVTPLVPPSWRVLYFLNPLAGLIDGFRAALLGGSFSYFGITVTFCFTVATLICAAYLFRHIEQGFADVI